jgi:RNA-binding protein
LNSPKTWDFSASLIKKFIIRFYYGKGFSSKGKFMDKLKGSQRKYLRSQAHHLKPLVIIGTKGVTGQLIGSVDLALKDHELIKVKFGEFKETKKEISEEIAKTTKSELVGLIGNIAIFYRQHPDPEKRKIKIP